MDFWRDVADEPSRIVKALPGLSGDSHTALLFGFGLVLVALGFKIAAVPFQFWVPDVYQGAPTPVTAYLSVASKAAGFVVLLRVVEPFFGPSAQPFLRDKIGAILVVLAAVTILFGNLAALPQPNLKRLLSYSSVGHAGYLLMAVASLGVAFAQDAIVFYLAAYLLMTFLAFAVLALVTQAVGGDDLSHFRGLARRSPGWPARCSSPWSRSPASRSPPASWEALHLRRRAPGRALLARRLRCAHGRLRFLLLPARRARNVLGSRARAGARENPRFDRQPRDHDRTWPAHRRGRRLSQVVFALYR